MKKSVLLCSAGLVAAFGAQAQELGRVLSSTPVIQQVAVPRQVCNQQQVAVEQPRSGAGSAIGAIAGGILGNTIGHGGGRAAATILGVVGGAVVGDRVEGNGGYQVQNIQNCSTQTFYENRTVAYNVTYEYNDRQYTVQMPNDPGPSVQLQVTPVGATQATTAQAQGDATYGNPQPVYTQPSAGVPIISSTTQVYPQYQTQYPAYPVYQQAPMVVVPAPYYRPYYYPPVGVSLNLGYSRGWHGHRGGWR